MIRYQRGGGLSTRSTNQGRRPCGAGPPRAQLARRKREGLVDIHKPFRILPATCYSPTAIYRSTIAAKALNFRVRNGNGCYLLAMVTGKKGRDAPRRSHPKSNRIEGIQRRASKRDEGNKGQASRRISTGQLNSSPNLHIQPINLVVFEVPLVEIPALRRGSRGDPILEEA